MLLIGDAALQFQRTNSRYPYEVDLGFEWWLWQHLPCVFAVWAVRNDASPRTKKQLESGIARSLAMSLSALELVSQEHAATFGIPAAEVHAYLSSFIYRLGPSEEKAIARFQALVHEHHLL